MKKVIVILFIVVCCGLLYFVYTNSNSHKNNISNNNNKIDGKEEKYSFENQNGDDVEIKADKVVEATGFAGASNYKFYLNSEGILYFENISVSNSKEKIASGVDDVYLDGEQVTAKLSKNGKILKENNYIIYVNN